MKRLSTSLLVCMFFHCIYTVDIAITMDDYPMLPSELFNCQDRANAFIKAARKHNVKIAFFCIGRLCNGQRSLSNDKDWKPLDALEREGHFLANHSFSHPRASMQTLEKFITQLKKTEEILAPYKQMRKWFRFPYLDYGNIEAFGGTTEKALSFYSCLKQHGYKDGYTTIETPEWYINEKLTEAIIEKKSVDYEKLRNLYIYLLKECCIYFINIYKRYDKPHTLLLHVNDLNALFLDDVLAAIKESGWKIVSPEDAFQDTSWYENLLFNTLFKDSAIKRNPRLRIELPPVARSENIYQIIKEQKIFK